MKIVLLESLAVAGEKIEALAAPLRAAGHAFVDASQAADKTPHLAGAEVFIVASSPLPEAYIEAAPGLKLISVAFTGLDHIPLDLCRAKGIEVVNSAGYSTDAVAELTLGLILSCLRNIPACDAATRTGGTKDGLVGHELRGKTVGIIGTGAIGQATAKLCMAFGCRVLGYSRSERPEARAMGIEYKPLDELLAASDIVTLHTPLTDDTRGLIGARELGLMQPMACLVNVARGPVVDSAALAAALEEGRLGAAGIDVFETEPPIAPDHPLLHAPRVVLTPHVAFATAESMVRRADIVFGNVYGYAGITK